MRDSELLAPRVLLTLGAVLLVGLVWSVMAIRGTRDGAPAPPDGARSALQQINRRVVVTGRIQSVTVDLVGNRDTVAIAVPRVGTFRIADWGKGRDLKRHIGDTVRVTAITRLDPRGREVLDVEGYSVAGL